MVDQSSFLANSILYNQNLLQLLVLSCQKYSDLLYASNILEKLKSHLYELVLRVQTDIFYENGNSFNKGAAIDYGLSLLENRDWVIHLDADIYLPPLTRSILENIPLETHKIYGADRLMCPSYEKWAEFINAPRKIQEGWVYIHMDPFPIGVRIAEYNNKDAGYEPIGYFQLWNPRGSGVFNYPTKHDYCDRTDVLHCKKFARRDRELLPEIIVIHLESEGLSVDSMGKNWRGRKTRLFEPQVHLKDKVDLEIKELHEKANEILKKYNLSCIFVNTSNKKTSTLWRIFNKLRSILFGTNWATYRRK